MKGSNFMGFLHWKQISFIVEKKNLHFRRHKRLQQT